MKVKSFFFSFCQVSACFLLFFFCFPLFSLAGGMQPAWKNISGVVLVVDKDKQKLFVYDGKKRKLLQEFICTTGQVRGNKLIEGDQRTPEGVYFIERGISSGLDFELYGGKALVLNFPNPADKAAKKTGYGIWIHGRGREIVPRDTQGCVALHNEDFESVKSKVDLRQTPIFISSSLPDEKASCSEEELDALLDKTECWARSWAAKQDEFFSFYDQIGYNAASKRSFAHFRAQKKALFSRYAWIDVFLSNLRIVCSDTYAITYFGQLYQAPKNSFEGIKRLYWQKNKAGQWKIIGEEWRKGDLGLKEIYRQQREPKLLAWLESWRTAWEQGNMEEYKSCYLHFAQQGQRKGLQAIVESKQMLWEKAAPAQIRLENIQIQDSNQGVVVTVHQTFKDASGYTDYGLKELLLYPAGKNSWKIVSENWKKL